MEKCRKSEISLIYHKRNVKSCRANDDLDPKAPPHLKKMAKIYHFVRNSILFGVDIQVLSLWEVDLNIARGTTDPGY